MSKTDFLISTLKAVVDSKSFLEFVRALIADREDEIQKEKICPSSPYGPGANGWENGSIEAFLDAAVSWAEATNFGERRKDLADNPWRQFAEFLYLGKIYE
ncbi:MAG: hypothetical protein ABSD44_09945 [Terracidiphilus sp.]